MAWFLTKLFCFNGKNSIMKSSFILSRKAWMAFVIACSGILLLSSCRKNRDIEPEPVGEAKVRYVNTIQGSADQDLYVNGTKKSTDAVAYGSASAYITITSGPNSFKYYNTGTTTVSAESSSYNFPIGISATVFNYQNATGEYGVFAVGDDMSAPAAGKAKVRFIYINSFAGTTVPGTVKVSVVGQTTVLIPALAWGDVTTAYVAVDPGAKFTFTTTGTASAELDGGIVAGKNYTVWIDGTSAASVTGHIILQN